MPRLPATWWKVTQSDGHVCVMQLRANERGVQQIRDVMERSGATMEPITAEEGQRFIDDLCSRPTVSARTGAVSTGANAARPDPNVPRYRGATISKCGRYRYSLVRTFDDEMTGPAKRVLFIMLNPSTADAANDDPTIRRCMGFARAWGYRSMEVVNLYSFRATIPEEMWSATDPVGDGNDDHIRVASHAADLVIVAWGKLPKRGRSRARAVLNGVLRNREVHSIGEPSRSGEPKHPLYLRANLLPEPYAKDEHP